VPRPLLFEKCDGYYRSPAFEKQGIRALLTTSAFDMSFDASDRPRAYKVLGVDAHRIACPHQVHGHKVAVVGPKDAGRGAFTRASAFPKTDALITAQQGLPIGVLTADCLPVLIAAPAQKAIAAVHAGWRGIQQNIIGSALDKMSAHFDVEGSDVTVILGPAIRACCYEVGEEFRDRFPGAVKVRDGRLYFDIAAAAEEQLYGKGVRPGAVFDSGICTCCAQSEFFSYRRQGAGAGRSMSSLEIC
jgi:YfiH family protein